MSSTQIFNCSFIDLMNQNVYWQVGYTGTVNIEIANTQAKNQRIPNSVDGFSKVINKDTDEEFGVKFALCGTYKNSENNLYTGLETPSHIFSKIKSLSHVLVYDALIDVAAVFKEMDSLDIVKEIAKISQYRDKIFVYMTNENEAMEYRYNKAPLPHNKRVLENPFYYYSQKHTVGIDFLQKTKLRGAITINNGNIYTDVAQGIYRLRKLNRGHVIDIFYQDDDMSTKEGIYNKIILNEKELTAGKKDMLEIQNLKYHLRLYNDNSKQNGLLKKYFEGDTKQYYQLTSINKNTLLNYFISNIRDSSQSIDHIKKSISTGGTALELFNRFINKSEPELMKCIFNENSTETEQEKENVNERQRDSKMEMEVSKEYLLKDTTFIINGYLIPGNSMLMNDQYKKCMFHITNNGPSVIYGAFDLFVPTRQILDDSHVKFYLAKYGKMDGKMVYVMIPKIDAILRHYLRNFLLYDYRGILINNHFNLTTAPETTIKLTPFVSKLCSGRVESSYSREIINIARRQDASSSFLINYMLLTNSTCGLKKGDIRLPKLSSTSQFITYRKHMELNIKKIMTLMNESSINYEDFKGNKITEKMVNNSTCPNYYIGKTIKNASNVTIDDITSEYGTDAMEGIFMLDSTEHLSEIPYQHIPPLLKSNYYKDI